LLRALKSKYFQKLLGFLILSAFSILIATSCAPVQQKNYPSNNSFSDNNAGEENFHCKDCNVLFISLSNTRADHLGLYGYHRNTSPHLDSFSKNSIVFENAFSVASWTLPASMSLYTSTYPFTHNVMTRYTLSEEYKAENTLSKKILTLVDILNEQGYATASFNGGIDYSPRYGLTNRFQNNHSYKLDQNSSTWNNYGPLHDVVPEVLRWLEQNRNRKFFLHLQAYDTHCPFGNLQKNTKFDPDYESDIDFSKCYWTFDKTKPFTIVQNGKVEKYYNLKASDEGQAKADAAEGKHVTLQQGYIWQRFNERDIEHMIALYDGEIFNADRQIERIFKQLEKLHLTDNTIIVFFSEHGDMFGKYGRFMRGGPLRGTFYDDVLHIPLVIYHPNLKPKKIKSLASLIDIAPTLLEFLGYQRPSEFEGQSLIPILKNDNIQRKLFSGAQFIPPENNSYFNYMTLITAVRDEEWKLIKEEIKYAESIDISYELFSIRDDPQELHNLAEENFEQLEKYNKVLDDWIKSKLKKESIFRKN